MKKLIITLTILYLAFTNAEAKTDEQVFKEAMQKVMKKGKLIVYQNDCDFKKASSSKGNECIEYPRKKNGKLINRSLGMFLNVPKKYNEFDFPICGYLHVHYGYQKDDLVIHVKQQNGKYHESKVLNTKINLEKDDYKRFMRLDKKGNMFLGSISGSFECRRISELLIKPDESGIFDFYFTFRGRKSNIVQIELTLDKSSFDGTNYVY